MLIAAIQICAKEEKKKNLATIKKLMLDAVKDGAKLIALPECFGILGKKSEMLKAAELPGKGLTHTSLSDFAKSHKVYILAGSIPTKSPKSKKLKNRSVFFGPNGKIIDFYDKLHLFNPTLTEVSGYRESDTYHAGSNVKVIKTKFGKVGLSICYDLRFPELYRQMTLKGAQIIFVPAAFAMHTGKDHWMPLLQARAIENQVYIVAPAQWGRHTDHKVSYGKTCIIDPWGTVLATAPDKDAMILAEVDFDYMKKIRKNLPVLEHARTDVFKF